MPDVAWEAQASKGEGMTVPAFNDPFNIAYDSLSIHKDWVTVPSWCHVYEPDNTDDFQCLKIIQPAPDKGSKLWTLHGKRILIGVFRDEGRATQQQDVRVVQWLRAGTRLIIASDRPHFMVPGDAVNLWNVNVATLTTQVTRLLSTTEFEVVTSDEGAVSGISGGYQPVEAINFYEDFVVFRLLPSMKLISWDLVMQILDAGEDLTQAAPVRMYDVTTGQTKLLASAVTKKKPTKLSNGSTVSGLRNRQQVDENGNPIPGSYDARGKLVIPNLRYGKDRNTEEMVNPVLINLPFNAPAEAGSNDRLYVYDYYGFLLNDDARGPYYATDNVYYDSSNSTGLGIKQVNSKAVYSGTMQDEFGNIVIGARPDNSLLIRQAIIPLQVDQFNVPYKQPRKDFYGQ
jgi:hypothetical protein